jgi:putative AdoMet-dependent methyltransferase
VNGSTPATDSAQRVRLFDRWAAGYDRSMRAERGFPFQGYDETLDAVVRLSAPTPGMSVLDVGIGTGNLAERFAQRGCSIWGIDFSASMIEAAESKLPEAVLVQANLRDALPDGVRRTFNRIVSAYVFHEFDAASQLEILGRLRRDCLDPQGLMVVADIAFETADARAEVRAAWQDRWDDDEHYWAADEALLAFADRGIRARFIRVSFCAGVFVLG